MADTNFREPASIPLAEALAQLPVAMPDRSAWPMLATRLAGNAPPEVAGKSAPRRWLLPAALAASLLALALLPRGVAVVPGIQPGATGAVANTSSLTQLMAESARLESLISASDANTSSASAAVLSLELEERLQQLDASLTANTLADTERQSLMQQRVALLRDYAGFESTRRWYAAEGRNLDVALVAAY